jgi:DNA (cytosine-5)-methyltransferase 1
VGVWLIQEGSNNPRVSGTFAKGRRVDLEQHPAPTVTTSLGFAGFPYRLEEDGRPPSAPARGCPPYAIPDVAEALAAPADRTVASTFSGCGGSCLGYRLAGFEVRAAVELAEVPRRSYRENFGWEPLGLDVREMTAATLLDAAGVGVGELDLLDGSPPCTPFSTVGKRQRGWRVEVEHAGKRQRVDDLFLEFARLVDGVRPRALVAENVTGLAHGTARGYFRMVLGALRSCGYRVAARVLDAQWLGVPQRRQRVFVVGVRDDLGVEPPFPVPLGYRYSVRGALPGLRLGGRERFSIPELLRIGGFPDDFVLRGTYSDQWAQIGNSVPPPVARAVGDALHRVLAG